MKSIGVIYALNGHPIQRDLADRMAVVLRGRGNLLRHAHHPSVMLLQALWKEQVPDVWAEASPSTHLAGDVRLYYHQDLCQRLEVGGVWQRAPLSDLDLIAQAYARWGTRCVDYLEGDYCFVLWDERQHQLFAARSPFGLRPLLYARTPTALLLASDTELLRAAAPQIPLTLDPEWLAVFLVKDRHRRGTMFLSIEEVPPGSSLVFREDGSCTQTTFWPPTVLPPLLSYRDQRDYTIQFRTLLREAVGERIADASVRPILCDVSGGLDSSTIACLAAQQWTAPFPLYGIHFSSVRYQEKDDRSFAQAVAKAYPTLNLRIVTEEEAPLFVSDDDEQRGIEWDLPHSAALIFARYLRLVTAFASQHGIQGYLRGTFGDQLFLPAKHHYLWRAWQEHRYRLVFHDGLRLLQRGEHSLSHLLYQEFMVPACQYRRGEARRRACWLLPQVWDLSHQSEEQECQRLKRLCPHPFYREFYRLMDRYTTYVSHHCSPLFVEAGLEVRDPFTDPRLMRFLLSCPPQIHKGNGESKHLLREATRGVLPELVRTRTTKGRLSRPIFAALHQQAQHFRRLALTQPACLMPFLDAHRLAHVLEHVLWIAEIPQPSLFSSLALLGWAHRQKRKEE